MPARAAIALLLALTLAQRGRAIDWDAFDDPKAFVLTGTIAQTVSDLPEAQRAAAIKRLQESLKAKEVEIRRRAALTLGALGDTTGVPVMIADMKKAQGRDRDNVVVALRVLKDRRAVPVLREALKDKSPYVRGIAVSALGELKAAGAYKDIVAITKDKQFRDNTCIRDCPAHLACYALGALGEKKAVPVLIDLLQDKDVKESARQALEVLTKQKFGHDADKWTTWWRTQKP
ncbi:MAG TPA: HEAT repeat domain-containing protein [Gemmataceae bacterium]|jgi:HEAT repeat protein|nr:HEAT repeat domain-containing protein [Gemmataceae bacterium]